MPVTSFEIRARGPIFEQDNVQELFDREVATTLRSLGLLGQRIAVGETPAGVASGGGGLRGSIFTELRGAPGNRSQIIASPLFYGPVVEVGRTPGAQRPPLDPILLWTRRKLGLSGAGAAHAAWLIARAIGRRGTVGRHMFAITASRLAAPALAAFQDLGARLAQRLGGAP